MLLNQVLFTKMLRIIDTCYCSVYLIIRFYLGIREMSQYMIVYIQISHMKYLVFSYKLKSLFLFLYSVYFFYE